MDIHIKHSIGEHLFTLISSEFCCYIAECKIVEVNISVKLNDNTSLDDVTTCCIVEYYDGETLGRISRPANRLFDNPQKASAFLAESNNIQHLPIPTSEE